MCTMTMLIYKALINQRKYEHSVSKAGVHEIEKKTVLEGSPRVPKTAQNVCIDLGCTQELTILPKIL